MIGDSPLRLSSLNSPAPLVSLDATPTSRPFTLTLPSAIRNTSPRFNAQSAAPPVGPDIVESNRSPQTT